MNKNNTRVLIRTISLVVFLFSITALTVFGADGDVDTTFNASAYGNNIGGNVYVVRKQSDGKLLVAGFFTAVNGFAGSGLVRLNVDGSIDTSFNTPDIYSGFGPGSRILAIGIQSNGKILIGGDFYGAANIFAPGIKRLNIDGSLDTTFTGFFTADTGNIVYDIEVLPNDKILIGGSFRFDFGSLKSLSRLNVDGSLDSSFQAFPVGGVTDIEVQSDGQILAGGSNFLMRFSSEGATDSSLSPGTVSGINVIKSMAGGKILIAGSFSAVNGFPQGRLAMLNSNGSIDFNFNLNGTGANGNVSDVKIKTDGKMIITGGFASFNSITRRNIAQLNADGTLDESFQNNTILVGKVVNKAELLPDGKIFVGTDFNTTGTITQIPGPVLYKFNSDGSSATFANMQFSRNGRVRDLIQQPDGKVLIGGAYYYSNGQFVKGLARVNADGTLDTSFQPFFSSLDVGYSVTSVDLQSDGKIFVGADDGILIKRLNTDGSLDSTFNPPFVSPSSIVNDFVVQSNDKLIAVGSLGLSGGARVIARFNSNGSVDSTFNNLTANGSINRIALQPDGKVLIAGDFTQIATSLRGRIARLNTDGTLDNTFNPPGGANGAIYGMDLQSDGKVVVGGAFTSLNGNNGTIRIGRYNSDGTLDTSFLQSVNASVLTVKTLLSGKVLIGGAMNLVGNVARNGIARLNYNGSLDTSFNTFSNSNVWALNLQADGKILVGGEFTKLNQLSNVRVGRLNNLNLVRRARFDFDGDGKADVSVLRPSTNRWYEFLSGSSQVSETTFGVNADVIAPADYDGDGKTDLGIFRPSTGNWWYLSSVNSTQNSIQFGASGDIPRPSDFDGDGRDDFVIFRPSNNVWYRLSSGNGAVAVGAFGSAGDKPLVGDFDGDGKSDLAIYRPSTGTWWYQSSINNAQIATAFGVSTDIPVPADYDGDGKTDLAVYRPSTGVWYILNSSTGQATIVGFGLAEDKPVAADYDGDGKADIAVFRPSTGVWYLLRSTAGFTALQFGISTDIPIPNSFIQ